ncbi:MAG: phosphoribosyltransferase family protein [Patescibacteria group bacterium]
MFGLFGHIIDFLFPARCAGCGKTGGYLCLHCRSVLPRSQNSPNPEIETFYKYRKTALSALIWKLKYRGGRDIAKIIGELFWENLAEKMSEVKLFSGNKQILLVPIPIHPGKRRGRGFNQTELIGKEIAKLDGGIIFKYSPDIIIKIKETLPQMEIKEKNKRVENAAMSFSAARPESVRGQTVLVIDDVTTTGATLLDAKRALMSAGARKVYLAALSH